MKEDVFTDEAVVSQKFDLYQDVTNKIIGMIENGVVPWRKPWSSFGLARNYLSGHIYTGINFILMNNTNHKIPYFLTLNQIESLGASLKDGAKSEKVIYFNMKYKDENDKFIDDDTARNLIKQGKILKYSRYIKYYKVFGIEDIQGIELDLPITNLSDSEKIDLCENVLLKMVNMPEIFNNKGEGAFYSVDHDFVNIPDICLFNTNEHYYSTLFHELIHATGHSKRLNREEVVNPTKFGSLQYSKEEIVAEMGASFLCASVHIDNEAVVENSAGYLAHWLEVLKEDSKFIFKVAADSQKAVDFILNSNVH